MQTAAVEQETVKLRSIPETMQAAVYRAVNDVRVETVPVPRIGRGEVLLQVVTCGVCGTDLKKIHTGSHSAPRIFGHEIAGIVAAVGEDVEGWEVGDHAMAFHHSPCGDCYYCRKKTFAQCNDYKRVGCTAGFEPSGGGFAEYIRVMDWIVRRGLIKLPKDLPFEQAAFIEPLNTTYKGVKRLLLEPDETVLVIGQGPIGILLATLARSTGAKVLTSDLYSQRHAIARTYGLEHPIDASTENVVERVRAESAGRGADAVMLAVGGNSLIRTAMDAARPGGRIMLFAQTQHGDATFDPATVCMDEKTLMGSYSSSAEIQDEGVRMVIEGYRNGYDLTRLISHRFPLSDAAEAIAFASVPHPDSMKVMIEPGR